MSDLLSSIKADLTDRRLLPLVALVLLGLVGAIAYAALGGSGGSTPAASVASVPPAVVPSGLQVSGSTPDKSVAETTDGEKEQQSGKARNPFTSLPETGKAAASTTTSPGSASAGTQAPSKSSEGGGASSPEPSKTEPSKKAAPKPGYHVAVLFGLFPAGAIAETVTLTPYENLKLQTPLPSVQQPLIVFRGVTTGGKSATFTLIGEAILHGNGACLPNASQCEAIDLKPGQTEQLEYLKANGETVIYELRVVSITVAKQGASAASVKGGWAESRAGNELLRRRGLEALPFLHYSAQPGVLAFAGHKAFGARASAKRSHHHSR